MGWGWGFPQVGNTAPNSRREGLGGAGLVEIFKVCTWEPPFEPSRPPVAPKHCREGFPGRPQKERSHVGDWRSQVDTLEGHLA